MNMVELIDYWKQVPGVDRISIANLVTFPKYCSPLYLYEHHIQEGLEKVFTYLKKYDKVDDTYYRSEKLHVSGVNNLLSVKPTIDKWEGNNEIRKRMMQWIDFCLISRFNDEDIFEMSPYLNEYKK